MKYKYKCDICNRPLFKKNKLQGMVLCSKHWHQILKYGKALDNNPRSQNDLNEFRYLDNNTIEFDVYNQKSEVVNHFWIDTEDLQKVRYHKWRIDKEGKIVTGNPAKKDSKKELGQIVMGLFSFRVIGYIDGDFRNNRKSNLCIDNPEQYTTKQTNKVEVGIKWDKSRHRYAPEIQKDGKRYHLSRYKTIEEARYARYIAELILFKEFRNQIDYDFGNLSDERKLEIKQYVENKINFRQ